MEVAPGEPQSYMHSTAFREEDWVRDKSKDVQGSPADSLPSNRTEWTIAEHLVQSQPPNPHTHSLSHPPTHPPLFPLLFRPFSFAPSLSCLLSSITRLFHLQITQLLPPSILHPSIHTSIHPSIHTSIHPFLPNNKQRTNYHQESRLPPNEIR